jgi:hypothetical protein
LLVLGALSLLFRRDLITPFLGPALETGPAAAVSDPARDAAEDPLVKFVSFVIDDNQNTWTRILSAQGRSYRRARLVLFRDEVVSACGAAESASGPFYCPGDEKVYLDLAFFDELRRRFGAPGEFAQAYVIAHEFGHHLQNVMGIEREVRRLQRQDRDQQNALSVRMELQADCLAGVWGNAAAQRGIVEPGDAEAALRAAAAVGDDHIQKMAGRRVTPDAFTHGSSEQRMQWFRQGLRAGDVAACDTFGAR